VTGAVQGAWGFTGRFGSSFLAGARSSRVLTLYAAPRSAFCAFGRALASRRAL